MITLFLKLLLAHLLGDFVLQPTSWVRDKKRRKSSSPFLYWHIAIHAILLAITLQFDTYYWLGFLFIVISHYLIDWLKLELQGKWQEGYLFFADQVAHVLVLLLVAVLYTGTDINWSFLFAPELLLLACAVIMVTYTASIIMRVIMDNWKVKDDSAEDSLAKAGKYIGMIERLLVFLFVVLNQWSAIGFLIAAKSILRFSDLSKAKDRKLTEYIIIGTLLSITMAIVTGLAYKYMLPYLTGIKLVF
ncbi:DUF3307 domain-containing protein [Niabella hibiscisoli]|uniref:DUF3307 domain-containing protein n=1 Tax=Niabella hibiscisoli TaxID=1825928 RepID=UPI001F0FC6A8|nr:DUF3307 domain-containing protein [Niabella hibiscisoli]MCH5718808.1 DUF3307 domain-containing protein [Niabella hibiscisoli]